MKKIIALILALCLCVGLCSAVAEGIPADQIKIGYITIGDQNEGYSANHLGGLERAIAALGIDESQVIYKYNVPESEAAYEASVDLAEQGCNIIFATSFGHETYELLAAEEYPEVEFCHATGSGAAASGLSNFHNYFYSVYESRYVSGIVAGLKLQEMIDNGTITADQAKIGYVGAFPFAEVISGYTSFYLGARSVCPSATMEVKYTNSWGDLALEKETAEALIASGCVMIGQHADTTGAPSAAQAAGVYCVGYNIDMTSVAPDTALTSAAGDWGAYVKYALECVMSGEAIATDWCQGYADSAVYLTGLNESIVAPGTAEKVAEAEAAFAAGEIKVFDCANFTVGGEHLTEYVPYGMTENVIVDGVFAESSLRSAPYFDCVIDGISVVE